MEIAIHIWTKIKGLWIENIEKENQFCNFRSEKIDISYRSQINFYKTCNDTKKQFN